MEGKLIKTEVNYILENDKGVIIASTSLKKKGLSLSLKNCQAIENGYDLGGLIEEVREEFYQSKLNLLGENTNKVTLVKETAAFSVGFDRGFKKALEFIGDKKFSEGDMKKACAIGIDIAVKEGENDFNPFEELLESLQQTEWDVEIVMGTHCKQIDHLEDGKYLGSSILRLGEVPMLDSEGCLILKRK